MDSRLQCLVIIVLLLSSGCRSDEIRSDPRSPDPIEVQVAMFARMADSADQDLRRHGEELRPYCLSFESSNLSDLPSQTLSGVKATGREVYSESQCDSLRQVMPMTTLWFAPEDSARPTHIAGGYVLGGTWGRGYECSLGAEGREVSLTDCRLIEIY